MSAPPPPTPPFSVSVASSLHLLPQLFFPKTCHPPPSPFTAPPLFPNDERLPPSLYNASQETTPLKPPPISSGSAHPFFASINEEESHLRPSPSLAATNLRQLLTNNLHHQLHPFSIISTTNKNPAPVHWFSATPPPSTPNLSRRKTIAQENSSIHFNPFSDLVGREKEEDERRRGGRERENNEEKREGIEL